MDYAAAYRQRNYDSIGSYSAYLELHQPSSFDLMRMSIIQSIRSRDFEHQGFLEKRYDGSTRSDGHSNPKITVVEVENTDLTDNESDLSDLEQSNSVESKQNKYTRQKAPENDDYIEPFNKKNFLNIDFDNQSNTNESSMNSGTGNSNDHRKSKKSDKNSLKLARRKFNNTIFEDCSTYNITSQNVELEEDNDNNLDDSSKTNQCKQKHKFADNNLHSTKMNIPVFSYSDANSDRNPEEHASLCDTFFPHVNDCDSQSAAPIFEQGSPTLVEKNASANDEVISDAGEKCAAPNKRKHSRRHRKRSRKKSKAKKPFIYECSKCGVSYVIPTKGMNKVACCLHCDFWIPVEPVFVRRDKTTWNTCQIC